MSKIERIGAFGDRATNLLELDASLDLPGNFELPSPRFLVLIAWDAEGASREQVCALVSSLLDHGAVFFCCWGPDCERVHDLVDEIDIERNPDFAETGVIMTTWHNDESLEAAIDWSLLAWPDPWYEEGFAAVLGVSIDNPGWAETMRAAYRDPKTFLANRPDE